MGQYSNQDGTPDGLLSLLCGVTSRDVVLLNVLYHHGGETVNGGRRDGDLRYAKGVEADTSGVSLVQCTAILHYTHDPRP
jgi:hypothetical protein